MQPTTSVKSTHGESKEFGVKVGVHRGSLLSRLLFAIVIKRVKGRFTMGAALHRGFGFVGGVKARIARKD
jgi:hypothetical protein